MDKHECKPEDLTYEGEYGAPGIGQAWRCEVCGTEWSRVGGAFYPAESMAHVPDIEAYI